MGLNEMNEVLLCLWTTDHFEGREPFLGAGSLFGGKRENYLVD